MAKKPEYSRLNTLRSENGSSGRFQPDSPRQEGGNLGSPVRYASPNFLGEELLFRGDDALEIDDQEEQHERP